MTRPRMGVIGAGIVGLAVARRIQLSGAEVTVLEKESTVAAHQTGHNSNVVHSGVYYAPGSLKATLTRRGVKLLREFCSEHGLAWNELGKVIVAVDRDEVPRLHALAQRAISNGIPDTKLLGPAELREREPHVAGLEALFIPSTAVVDYRAIAGALADEVAAAEGRVLLGERVTGIQRSAEGVRIVTDANEHRFDHVIVCAGLQSSELARLAGADREPQVVPIRGEYYELAHDRGHLVNGLVYPVSDPRVPFLGVHFTPGLDGHVHVGPNAVPALALEGYRWRDIDVGDLWRSATYPGTARLALGNWRMGVKEILGSAIPALFLAQARKYLPALRRGDLTRADAGVRAQALRRDGSLVDDFVIDRMPNLTLVRNAPSPAATASLAIAERVIADLPELSAGS